MVEIIGFIIGLSIALNARNNAANERRLKELEKRPAVVGQPIQTEVTK